MSITAVSAFGNAFGQAHRICQIHGHDVADRADLAAVLVTATHDDAAQDLTAAGFPVPSSAGPMTLADGICAIWLSPRSWILQCPPEREKTLFRSILVAFPDAAINASLFGDHLAWLEIAGPDPQALLRRGGFVSFDMGGLATGCAKRTVLARVNAVLCRPEPHRILAGVERSRAGHLVAWLQQAATEPAPDLTENVG